MKRNVLLLLCLVVVLALFFYFTKSSSKQALPSYSSPTPVSSAESSPSASTQTNSKVFELVVKNNKLVSGPDTLSVTEGDQVTIKITADVDGELHLHGYDKHVDFKKDTPAELQFSANTTGRFPYELEDTKTEIGALEVQPK